MKTSTPLLIGLTLALGALGAWWVLRAGPARDALAARAPENPPPKPTERVESVPTAGNDGPRRPTPPPPAATPAGPDPDEGLRAIAAVGARLDHALDLVKPAPDLELLRELRELVERHGLAAAQLLAASDEFELGDPRARALTLAAAWGSDPGTDTDAALTNLACGSAPGNTPVEQHALAAVWALELGGRARALADTARGLLELGLDGDPGQLDFEGLEGVRAWIALRGLERLPEHDGLAWARLLERSAVGALSPESEGANGRVSRELWVLAARSQPGLHGRAAIDAALAGSDAARTGLEALGASFPAELAGLALQPASIAPQPWLPASALKGLVAEAADEGLEVVRRALASPPDKRGEALEALRTWRAPRDPHRQLAALLELRGSLDDEARTALDQGLARVIDATLIRRLDPAVRAPVETTLAAYAGEIESGPLAASLALWVVR